MREGTLARERERRTEIMKYVRKLLPAMHICYGFHAQKDIGCVIRMNETTLIYFASETHLAQS